MSVQKSKFKTIYITGEINDESFKKFHYRVQLAMNESKRLDLVIQCEGGSSLSALAYFDLIRSYPFGTRATVHGYAQSAATLVFLACKERFMGKSAWLMFHEDQYGDLPDMSTTNVEVLAARARRFEDQWLDCLYVATGVDMKLLTELHDGENWYNKEQCEQFGLLTSEKK